MAPCEFFLFLRLKFPLRSQRFESINTIKENSLQILKDFHKNDFKDVLMIGKNGGRSAVGAYSEDMQLI